MLNRPRILLISHLPELHYDSLLINGGFDVTNAESLNEGLAFWRPFHFKLVLIVVEDDLPQALAFCDELKKIEPGQCVAFVTGWHTFVPPSSCPDDVIQRDYNPSLFVKKVSELAQAQ